MESRSTSSGSSKSSQRSGKRRSGKKKASRAESSFAWADQFGSEDSKNAFRKFLRDNTDTFASMNDDTTAYTRTALSKRFGKPFSPGSTFDRSNVDRGTAKTLNSLMSTLKSGMKSTDAQTGDYYLNELHKHMGRIPNWDTSTGGTGGTSSKGSNLRRGREQSTEAMDASTAMSELESDAGWEDIPKRKKKKGKKGRTTRSSQNGKSTQGGKSGQSRARRTEDISTTPDDSSVSTKSTRKKKGGKKRRSGKSRRSKPRAARTDGERSGRTRSRSTGRSSRKSRREDTDDFDEGEDEGRRSSRSRSTKNGKNKRGGRETTRISDSDEEISTKRKAPRNNKKKKGKRDSSTARDEQSVDSVVPFGGFPVDPSMSAYSVMPLNMMASTPEFAPGYNTATLQSQLQMMASEYAKRMFPQWQSQTVTQGQMNQHASMAPSTFSGFGGTSGATPYEVEELYRPDGNVERTTRQMTNRGLSVKTSVQPINHWDGLGSNAGSMMRVH